MLLEVGQRVDRYVLMEPLGEGGQGAVWKATDPLNPDRPCALKLVPVHPGRQNELERVRREARSLASLEHPSLVQSSALFEDLKLGVLGIAMEWVEGASLKRLSREGRLSTEQSGLVLEHVARALDYLHRSSVVHRDVKLDNVLVRERFWEDPSVSENVKLVDLGIAAPAGAGRDLTSEGTVIGTLPYLAPELLDPATFEGEPSSPRIDVFAFGVMGWLLLTGRHPSGLEGSSTAVEYTKAYRARAAHPEGFPVGNVDDRWREVLVRCLELEPAKRLEDAGAVLALLAGRAPDSVVVRPSRDPAFASPFEATAPAVPVPALASAATVPIAKPALGKPARHVLPVFTLLVAAAIGVGVAMKLSVSSPPPRRSASPSASVSARAPERRAPVAPLAAPRDAEPESAAPDASVEASVELHPCHAGCSSGRGCGTEGCSAPLDPAESYAVRVGRVEVDADGTSVLGTYQTAEVCLSISGSPKAPICSPLVETLEAGVTRQSLEVAYLDLAKGLDVVVQYTLPGAGAAKLAEKTGVVLPDGATRQLLCRGLVVEELKSAPDTKIERVVLFLDDPKAQPVRCP